MKKAITILTICLLTLASTQQAKSQTFDFTVDFINKRIQKYCKPKTNISVSRDGNVSGLGTVGIFNLKGDLINRFSIDNDPYGMGGNVLRNDNGILFIEYIVDKGGLNQHEEYKISFTVVNAKPFYYPFIFTDDAPPGETVKMAAESIYNAFQHLISLTN